MYTFEEMFGDLFKDDSLESLWREVAEEIGAQVIARKYEQGAYISYDYKHWEIVFDCFTSGGKQPVHYSRMRGAFKSSSDFRFKIYQEEFYHGIAKFFGMQDIVIGDKVFDENFVIKSNDEARIQELLQSHSLKSLIQKQEFFHFELQDDDGLFGAHIPSGVNQLWFQRQSFIDSKQSLIGLFNIFTATLDELVKLGCASEEKVRVKY